MERLHHNYCYPKLSFPDMLLIVASKQTRYGDTKIVFRVHSAVDVFKLVWVDFRVF